MIKIKKPDFYFMVEEDDEGFLFGIVSAKGTKYGVAYTKYEAIDLARLVFQKVKGVSSAERDLIYDEIHRSVLPMKTGKVQVSIVKRNNASSDSVSVIENFDSGKVNINLANLPVAGSA